MATPEAHQPLPAAVYPEDARARALRLPEGLRQWGPTVLAAVLSWAALHWTAGELPPAWAGPAAVAALRLCGLRWAAWPVAWMSVGALLTGT